MPEIFKYDSIPCGASVKRITYIPEREWKVAFTQRKPFGYVIGLIWAGREDNVNIPDIDNEPMPLFWRTRTRIKIKWHFIKIRVKSILDKIDCLIGYGL
jgi:hypothetical protein